MNKKNTKLIDGNIFKGLRYFFEIRAKHKYQRTFVWCPVCNEDLCSNNSLIENKTYVRYECTNCGCRSEWDFDGIAPFCVMNYGIAHKETL